MHYIPWSILFIAILVLVYGSIGISSQPSQSGIPPPADCNYNSNIEDPKFYQEPCSNDTDCFEGPNSMVCKGGKCDCAENYMSGQRFVGEKAVQTVCIQAPNLFERCNTTCQNPAVCSPYAIQDSEKKTKVCQCAQPYRYDNGLCYLNCTEDEYYDLTKYKCIKKCNKNQVLAYDSCVDVADFNGPCEIDEQCQTAYSECNSKCVCKPGFEAKNFACIPQSIACPFGDVLKKGNNFVSCRTLDPNDSPSTIKLTGKSFPSPTTQSQNVASDCPEGHFCLISTGEYNWPSKSGFCCPLRPSACPIGLPHPIAKCDSSASAGKPCPYSTHFCQNPAPESTGQESLCCPRACALNYVQSGTKCLPEVGFGFQCFVKEQCYGLYADCIEGTCKCQVGVKQVGTPSNFYCTFDCDVDEVLHDRKCKKRLKLADVCTSNNSQLCPEYARCSSKNQCVCQCGMFTLADNVCAPPPICQQVVVHPVPIGEAGADKGAYSTPPPPIQRISDEERDKLLKSTTFCKVWGTKPPAGVKVVDKCPADQYCSQYITNLGICCAKPTQKCPIGQEPNEVSSCDMSTPLSCGLDHQCIKYLVAVDQDQDSKDFTQNAQSSMGHFILLNNCIWIDCLIVATVSVRHPSASRLQH